MTWCQERDVEAGETPEFMYSVISIRDKITLWTQPGWRHNWFIGSIQAKPIRNKYKLHFSLGDAPATEAWPIDKVEKLVADLISRIEALDDEG